MQFRLKDLLAKDQTVIVNEQLDVSKLFSNRQDVIKTGPLHINLTLTPVGEEVEVKEILK